MGRLRGLIWILGSIGALMPFVGLLGAVLGVMASFHSIGESAASGFDVVATGISQALIATAAGLFVALEAVILYNVLQNAVAAQGRELSLLVDETLEILRTGSARDEHQQPDA
jgi:biopolymer transport protein ExbB/TolQ